MPATGATHPPRDPGVDRVATSLAAATATGMTPTLAARVVGGVLLGGGGAVDAKRAATFAGELGRLGVANASDAARITRGAFAGGGQVTAADAAQLTHDVTALDMTDSGIVATLVSGALAGAAPTSAPDVTRYYWSITRSGFSSMSLASVIAAGALGAGTARPTADVATSYVRSMMAAGMRDPVDATLLAAPLLTRGVGVVDAAAAVAFARQVHELTGTTRSIAASLAGAALAASVGAARPTPRQVADRFAAVRAATGLRPGDAASLVGASFAPQRA